MPSVSSKCLKVGCPNTAHDSLCCSCLAQEANQRPLNAEPCVCAHSHSVTGDFAMVKRLLPGYAGGQPHHGYMLDVCMACLKELPERPYNPSRYHHAKTSPAFNK